MKKYAAYLASQHDAALQKVGGAAKLYDYAYTYNGFAAKLTAGQKSALEKQAGVLAVSPEEMVTADTSSTPAFLGLDGAGWALGAARRPHAGKKASAPARTSSSASSTRASGPRARASPTA